MAVSRIEFPRDRQVPPKRVVAFLKRELEKIDPEELRDMKNLLDVPQLKFVDGNASMDFRVYPRSRDSCREKARAIGIQNLGFEWTSGDSGLKLLHALESKALKYGDFNLPFVIAVNTLGIFDFGDHELRRLLYGCGPRVGGSLVSEFAQTETESGFWGSASRPRHRRVSGVILGLVLPWNLPRAMLKVFRNPWAIYPLPPIDWPIPVVTWLNGKVQESRPGTSISELFHLAQDWPGDLAG